MSILDGRTLRVKVTFLDEVLGTSSNNKELHEEFIASKAPDAQSVEEEVAAVGSDAVFEKCMTVFPKDEDGKPFAWDYQWKGYFKDACKALRKIAGSECSKIKAYKQEIDSLVFITQRKNYFDMAGKEIGICQRPLRASTAQGERVALASSESIPAGASMTIEIMMLSNMEKAIREMLDYGKLRGFGQWRNSGKGRFSYEVLK